jgi:hypothetical protein
LPGFPVSESEDGKTGTPVGLADPLKLFTVEMQDGKPILRISGQIYAGLTSKEEFENYHFTCQFKWGEKKWEPRLNSKRDSGVLYHCNGPHGAFWNVWMRSLECQVQEGDCGDFISLAGATASVQLQRVPEGKNPSFDPNAPLFSRGFGVVAHGPSKEKPHGEWNTLEIYTLGTTSVHVVNGTPNMVLFDARQHSANSNSMIPLTRGRIQIQSEAAEIYYRDIMIESIDAFPETLRQIVREPAEPAVAYQSLVPQK